MTTTSRRPAASAGAAPRVALVLFSGDSDLWWVRWLKPGFRHCLLLVRDRDAWLLYDPMAHMTELQALPVAAGTDIFGQLAARGYVVVPVRPGRPPRRAAPWAPFTCVEAVKRALGVHERWVLTPWQLFRHLTGRKKALTKFL